MSAETTRGEGAVPRLVEIRSHCPPLLVSRGKATPLDSTGLPLGLFSDVQYGVTRFELAPKEGLLLYTDGLSEASGPDQAEYGSARLLEVAGRCQALQAEELVRLCLSDLAAFQAGAARNDDLTLMAVRRCG